MRTPATRTVVTTSGNWWTLLREALLGSRRDLTVVPIEQAILVLAIPMILEMAMQSLFGVVDIFFVGRLGADATAAVGVTEATLVLVIAVALGLGAATTAMVARRVGAHDMAGADKAAVQAIILGLALSVVLPIAFLPFTRGLLLILGANQSVIAAGYRYNQLMLGTSGVIVMLSVINAVFRGAGDAVAAMRVLWLANIVNICLDPCLIFGLGPFPALGVTGAAIATITGRSVGIAFQLYLMLKGSGRFQLKVQEVGFHFPTMLTLLRITGSGVLQFLLGTGSWLVLVKVVQLFGTSAMAGYAIAVRMIVLTSLPSWALGAAAATLVGQNLGANHPDRAQEAAKKAGFISMLFLGCVALVFWAFAPEILKQFSHDPDVGYYGALCLRIVSLCFIPYGFGVVAIQALNGAGDTVTPSIIHLVCYWLVQLPLALVLGTMCRLGAKGTFMSIALTETLMSLAAIHFFFRGAWKRRSL